MRTVYRQQALFFRKAYEEGVHGWPVTGATPEVVAFLKRIGRGDRALDLGCGEGRHTILMAKMGYQVEAVDLEPLALRKAKALARGVRGIRFSRQDALDLRFPDGAFDVVIDSGCFHHIVKPDWKRYVRGIARILRPGGRLILTVFSMKFRHYPGEKRTRSWIYHRNHYDRFFKRHEIAPVFAPAMKLEAIREGSGGFWHCLLRKS